MKPLIKVFLGDSGFVYTLPNGSTKFQEYSLWEWIKFSWWANRNNCEVEISE